MDSLNDLIAMAQALLNNGFDTDAFLIWKTMAFGVLLGLLGPYHYYTRNFRHFTDETGRRGLLVGQGLLSAAKEEIAKSSCSRGSSDPRPTMQVPRTSPPG